MSDLLTSHREVGSVIRATDVANLSFIPAGPIPPSPTELLGSPRLVAVLDELRGNFDIIILDGPPVLGLADAPLIASIVRHAVFVVAASRGPRGAPTPPLRRLRTDTPHIPAPAPPQSTPKTPP